MATKARLHWFWRGLIAAGVLILGYVLLSKPSLESRVVQANQLIAAVGGPAKVLKEADEVFARFGFSEEEWDPKYRSHYLSRSKLKDYPALAALIREHAFNIYPYISIRFGEHDRGFYITIWPVKKPAVPNEADLFDSRIFVSDY